MLNELDELEKECMELIKRLQPSWWTMLGSFIMALFGIYFFPNHIPLVLIISTVVFVVGAGLFIRFLHQVHKETLTQKE